ncbi:MAG: agglutinin biogenesis protein MshP [Betaproteobacteria bacterium]|jgi:MSHA biogenesis protein MshP|nr:agglutinin biogenesis protein MshP [Betaproteobacteria bacterium]
MKNSSCPGQTIIARNQQGFSLVTAIFLITILMLLSAYMVGFRVFQDSSISLDTLGTRAYATARAGVEWGAYQALRPGPCVATTNTFAPGGTLAGFTATVTLTPTTFSEGGANNVTICSITANACNNPVAATGRCPNAAGGVNYVERQITIMTGQP